MNESHFSEEQVLFSQMVVLTVKLNTEDCFRNFYLCLSAQKVFIATQNEVVSL